MRPQSLFYGSQQPQSTQQQTQEQQQQQEPEVDTPEVDTRRQTTVFATPLSYLRRQRRQSEPVTTRRASTKDESFFRRTFMFGTQQRNSLIPETAMATPFTQQKDPIELNPNPPQFTKGQQILLAVGGIDIQCVDPDIPGRYIHYYDTSTNQWEELARMRDFTHHHGVAVLNGQVYIVGKRWYR